MFVRLLQLGITAYLLILATPSAQAGIIYARPLYVGLNSGLVGHWTFDGADTTATSSGVFTRDRSGNNYNARATTSLLMPAVTTGKIGQALSFNASNTQMYANAAAIGNTAVTVAGWIYVRNFTEEGFGDGTGAEGATMFTTRTDTNEKSPTMFIGPADGGAGTHRGAIFYFDTNGDAVGAKGATTIKTGQWYHIAGTFDNSGVATFGGNWNVYVNGVRDNASVNNLNYAGSASLPFTGAMWNFANSPAFPTPSDTQRSDIILDDLRVYNRALSGDEVKRLYNVGGSRVSAAPQRVVTDGLVGHWTFDGSNMGTTSAFDLSGNNNTGWAINGPRKVAGKMGQALGFNKSGSQYVNASDPAPLRLAGTWAVSGWINPATVPAAGTYYTLLSRSGGGGLSNYGIGIGNDVTAGNYWWTWFNQANGFNRNAVTLAPITPGRWYHMAGVWDPSSSIITLYVDGAPVAASSTSGNVPVSTAGVGVTIGNDGCCAIYHDGFLDDVRIYNRVLSDAEIKRLYTSGLDTKQAASQVNRLTDGLVGYWTFDGAQTGTTSAYDSSGLGNTGWLVSGPQKTQGKLGQALSFDGSDDWVGMGDDTDFEFPSATSKFAFSAWVKMETTAANDYCIVCKWGAATDEYAFEVGVASGIAQLKIYLEGGETGGNDRQETTNNPLRIGQWEHVAFTADVGTDDYILYINGVTQATTDAGLATLTDLNASGSTFRIGSLDGGSEFLGGSIDDVRVYNRTLSSDEILRLYNMGR